MLRTMLERSNSPLGRRAASSATGIATTSEINRAYATSSNVIGRSLPRIDVTLWPLAREWPRLPVSRSCIQFPYRISSGLFKPSCTDSWCTSWGVALMPSCCRAALPGRWLTTRNVRNVTPHRTGIAISRRRPMNRSIGEAASRASRPPDARIGGAGRGAEAVLLTPAPFAVSRHSRRGDVLPEDLRVNRDRRNLGRQPGALHAVRGDVVARDREQERAVRVLRDVLGGLVVELLALCRVHGRLPAQDQPV